MAAPRARSAPSHAPSMAQFMSAAFPQDLVVAAKADRIAWVTNDKGRRNVYTAAAPDFHAVRVTSFLEDNGIDITQLSISDDGATVVFTRGSAPNREGWIADPEADPRGTERALWAARTSGRAAWRLAQGDSGALSPDGRFVAFAKEGDIYRVPVAQAAPRVSDVDKGLKPYIRIWGVNANPVWSPDGKKLAFISSRTDHSFIAVYDTATKKITYMSPSTDWDTSPTWSRDSKRIAYVKRPGTPFAQQAQPGIGGLGNPPGPAYNPLTPSGRGAFGRGGGGFGRGGRGAGEQGRGDQTGPARAERPGLTSATFAGGYTVGLWVADIATGDADEFWHNAPNDKDFAAIPGIAWHGDHVVFQIEPQEWTRIYSVPVPATLTDPHNTGPTRKTDLITPSSSAGPPGAPVDLTPQDGQIESFGFSADDRYLYYGTNATDVERRHIWRVPIAGGAPEQITRGEGIEHDPVVLPSGNTIAVLSSDYKRPQSVGVFSLTKSELPCGESDQKVIFPILTKEFPSDAHVKPQLVMTKAADGLDIHNQLFLPPNSAPGEKHPAIIFVHGGPIRQMLLGYHYMEVYHLFYSVNQWLANQGYVVLSVNYRGGIGYGRSFRMAPNTNARGNSEYQDVVAGAKYLQSRPDVDPKRVGIWGLSYGGLLTSEALARNSDIFIAGVDLAGVHLYGNNLDPENLAYKSSAVGAIDKWKSPVLLIQGDDDRNVNFAQTVGLVDLLRAHKVPYELMVLPDDTHETLLYRRWLAIWDRMEAFLDAHLAQAR
jgi:dipeptidyl-peptidase 4